MRNKFRKVLEMLNPYSRSQHAIELLENRIYARMHQLEEHSSLVHFLNPEIPLPSMGGSVIEPDFANFLVRLVLKKKPRRILECGSGVSTLVLAYCLRKIGKGRVISLDHEKRYSDITWQNVLNHGLEEYADVVHAPLIKYEIAGKKYLWYDLEALSQRFEIDLLVVDGPPRTLGAEARYPAFPLLKEILGPDACIVLDDAARGGETRIVESWLRESPDWSMECYDLERGAVVLRRKTAVN